MRSWGKWLGLGAASALVATAACWRLPRRMIFPAPRPRPVEVPAGARLLEIRSDKADRTVYALWHEPPTPDAPVVVWLHGNGEQLADQAEVVAALASRGLGVLALEYPGYGPAAAYRPSEPAILEDARRGVDYLCDTLNVSPQRTVLAGRSLGTGVAVALAAERPVAGLVLISPYTSIPDVGRHLLRAPLPLGWLVRDRFDAKSKASAVRAPARIFCAERDTLIPPAMSERLARMLPEASVSHVAGAGHADVLARGGPALFDEIARFVRTVSHPATHSR